MPVSLDRFLSVAQTTINKVYVTATYDPTVRNIFCHTPPKAKPQVTPLFIQFRLVPGTDRRRRRVLVADAKTERYREELDDKLGGLFAQYVAANGGDPYAVPERLVEWTSRPFGIQIPNPDPPKTHHWRRDLMAGVATTAMVENGRKIILPHLPIGLAFGRGGERIIWWERKVDSHALVAGTTGSGKSELIRSVLASLIASVSPDDAEMVLIDMKYRSLKDFEGAPHVRLPLAYSKDDALAVLCALDAEMNRRIEQGESRALFIVIDELTDLTDDAQAQAWLTRIAQMGRELGMYIICGTQKPLLGNIGQMKAQIPARWVGRMASRRDAENVAETSVNSDQFYYPGSFAVVSGGGRKVDVRAFLVTSDAIAETVERAWQLWPDPAETLLVLPTGAENGRKVMRLADAEAQAEEDLAALRDEFGDNVGSTSMRQMLLHLGLRTKGEKYYEDKERVLRALALLEPA